MPSFTKQFEVVVVAALWKYLGPPMPKGSNDSCLQENQDLRQHALIRPVKLML